MSGGIFYLDEERDRERDTSPSPSPRHSPVSFGESQSSSPLSTLSTQRKDTVHDVGLHTSKSLTTIPASTSSPTPPSLQIPTTGQPTIFSPQPQVINRKHQVPFAATPSFPSPLAQAITVPLHSDTSSSGSHSDSENENERPRRPVSPTRFEDGTPRRRGGSLPRPRTASPHTSQSNSPASTQKSISRPPSPTRPQILTPSALLMKSKRSSSGSLLAGNIPTPSPVLSRDSPPRAGPSRVSPTHPGSRRFSNVTRGEGSLSSPSSPVSRRGSGGSNASLGVAQSSTYAGGSPLAFGSPELEPIADRSSPRRRSIGAGHSPRESREINVLGLGLGSGGGSGTWDTASSSSPGSSKEKGKPKDQSSGPPSPRVTTRERTQPLGIASPPRQRRPSEFLNPSSLDSRKMPIVGGPRTSIGGTHVPSLSTSASMISPLNPLPSSWADESDSSPFSPPKGQPSEVSSSTSTSSMGGTIRLNRVPASVKMATDLIKNNMPVPTNSSPPLATTASSTPSVSTPNPSPAGSFSAPNQMPTSRDLGHFASLPTAIPRTSGPAPLDIGKGRPTLSVPTTPRNPSPSTSPVLTTSVSTEVHKQPSTNTLAPPSAFKAPFPPVLPRPRPSLPADTGNKMELFPSSSKTHRYRTSMHEASFKRPVGLGESPPSWSSPSVAGSSSGSSGSQKSSGMGLGLNMPAGVARIASGNTGPNSGSVTPGAPPQLRNRSITGKALQMDLAGIGTLGDAASHASMIMQSRQAKLQRWRPNSAGRTASEGLLPPAFNRSTTGGAPAMLAAPRMDRQAQWGITDKSPTAASSPGEDLPPFPSALHELERVGSLPSNPSPTQPSTSLMGSHHHMRANAGPDRFAGLMAGGGLDMERELSAGGSIAGVEWVDWYECYKAYKAEKIRAQQMDVTQAGVQQLGDSPKEEAASNFASSSHSPILVDDSAVEELDSEVLMPEQSGTVSQSPQIRASPREIDLTSTYDGGSAIALTPQNSRDEFGQDKQKRRRSLSIRSTLSAIDPTRSPILKRNSLLERPRQTSGGSTRSSAGDSISSGLGGIKRKKNLVTKMEGWWNAVKSNFIPETHHPQPHQPHRRSNLGAYPSQRIPSAPTDRRESEMSPIATPQAALLAPEFVRQDSSQSLRQATSHAELRSRPSHFNNQGLQEAASIVTSASADLSRLSRESSRELLPPSIAHLMARKPSVVPEEPSRLPSRVPSTLEARRKGGPNLRLELESNVLTQPAHSTASSGSAGGHAYGLSSVPAHLRTGSSATTSSLYTQPLSGPGLTPGVPTWDQTPSPIYPLSIATGRTDDKEDRPIAPGVEITMNSVHRHVRHRLNAAKEGCDETLQKCIDGMTKFAEEQRAGEALPKPVVDDQPSDYFDAFSDSPLMDAEESEVEGGDLPDNEVRSRHASTSRPQSRRPSISRPVNVPGASPTKRTAMLPSSPNRVRRRPSGAPRIFPGQQRVSRNMSLTLDRTASATSSRSTSRSHSPMPSASRGLISAAETEALEGDKLFLAALQDLIVIATDILDSSVNTLLGKPGHCGRAVTTIQSIGAKWDEHDDWPGREWYVDILWAVANLGRVLDWWQAERGFWNFDENDNEPILFVMKPSGQKEDPRFDREFAAALSDARSPMNTLLQVPEQPTTAVTLDLPSPDPTLAAGTDEQLTATPHAAVDDLRFLAEHAKSVNIVMELSLQGEVIEYVNEAIMEVTGRDPEDCLNLPITDLLAPADASVFTEATQKLIEDDNNTVQLRFRFEVHELEDASHPPLQPGPVYVELEGVGMLMREANAPSHTMWVLKPVTATQVYVDMDSISEAIFPRNGIISTDGILCRICEREIVTWFFEKHNETCDAVHRLEAEITGCNECLHDLQQTVVDLAADIEDAPGGELPPYSGVLFYTLPDSITSGHEATIPAGPQGVEIRKIDKEHLQDVVDILATAQQIDVPSVLEDEADLPFNVQRYLTRDSEEKLNRIMRWKKPHTADRAFSTLLNHVEHQMRRKQKAIARMQSTIRYSEKTRHEWEDKVNQVLAERDEGSQSESGSEGAGAEVAQTPIEPVEAVDTSPPGIRKIAPQARLPITQGHPQRPSTSHGESSSLFTVAPPPFGQSSTSSSYQAPPNSAPLPAEARFQSFPLAPSPQLEVTKQESKSPLLTPLDAVGGHHRRASSSKLHREPPLSPRIPSAALHSRANPPSIKDFEIIKPISRGAFGSVYLAKKVATGDYFAIKALKKSDMIAKNQITNVKAERTILMNQASSPYVAKLFFSFQSKEYLYLVMEYLNGGDCATLVKTLGGLPEEWARNYIAEVVLGLEYLHARNIVHRDIKPDNLLIDARGHLKLTDFGLSRIGLLNRQVGGPRPAYLRGTNLRGSTRRPPNTRNDSGSSDSPMLSPETLAGQPLSHLSQSYFSHANDLTSADESSGSESAGLIPRHMRTMSMMTKGSTEARTPPRFVGTPDYLAPESILGIGSDDRAVDWWALGVVLYEFIYGIPPFHADSPEKVFDNVVSRRIDWHEDEVEISPAAHDLMDRLMCPDPVRRLGARGADEVKQHAFFTGIDWATITTAEASFVPEVTDPESTDYFDPRGATHGLLDDETAPQLLKQADPLQMGPPLEPKAAEKMSAIIDDMSEQDNFGEFNYKNVTSLKQANDDVIRKLRSDSMAPINQTLEGAPKMHRRPRSLSAKLRSRRKPSDSGQSQVGGGPPSPSTSTSSAASTPSRASNQPATPNTIPLPPRHLRRPSELNALDRVKSSEDTDISRRASAPTRTRAGSGGSSVSDRSTSMELWRKRRQVSLNSETSSGAMIPPPLESPESQPSMRGLNARSLDVLIAEDNPISQKILETLLTRMGCRCICVEDGPQALAATMGSIRFDVIICDIHMPVVSGEQVARMIRSTNNHNQNTPIIACTSYEQHQSITEEGTLFSAVLAKPVSKADLIQCLGKLGFILSSTKSGSQAGSTTDGMSTGTPV